MGKCRWCELVLAIVIFVAVLLGETPWTVSQWVIAIAAIVLALHSFMCKGCCSLDCDVDERPMRAAKASKSRRR